MANNIFRYEIELNNLVQGGVSCANPTVTWEKPSCPEIRCEYDSNALKLVVHIPEDCPDPCIYVIIDCEDCGECEPHRRKICPCQTSADCDDCEICVDNRCVDVCDEDEFCNNGTCVDCLTAEDCECNQVCVSGRCECPPTLPYLNDKGCCVACKDDTQCSGCDVCVGEECVPKDCGDYYVNPETCDCVECLSSNHCSGVNECCIGNKCDCCPGFVRNPATGECEPAPDCVTEKDCRECETCVGGDCVPFSCPPGFINIGFGTCCVEECNCDNPDCSGNLNCVDLDGQTCYCEPCTGTCDENDDCPGESCYCDNGECKSNPCYKPCYSGADCDPGCGCVDGICTPCDSLPCDLPCEEASGCECNEENYCVGSPCVGPCTNPDDCAPGCGCYNGECTPCSEIPCNPCKLVAGCQCIDGVNCVESPCDAPCAEGDDCATGCGCLDNRCVDCESVRCSDNTNCPKGCYCDGGVCTSNPCGEPCANNNDCPNGCDCEDGVCTPCAPNCAPRDESCPDSFILYRDDDNCDIVARRQSEDCCACDDISLGAQINNVTFASGGVSFTVDLHLRKGSAGDWVDFLSNPYLSDTGIDNDLPRRGIVEVEVIERLANGTVSRRDFDVDVTDKDGKNNTLRQPITGVTAPGAFNSNNIRVVSVAVNIRVKNTIEFYSNCQYSRVKENLIDTTDANFQAEDAWTLTKETNCRKPIFTWYKTRSKDESASNLFSAPNIFRRYYADKVGSAYEDKITNWDPSFAGGPQEGRNEGETCRFYGVSTDCGCNNRTVYDCNRPLSEDPKKLTFRQPKDFVVEQDTCGFDIKFPNGVIINCDIMNNEPDSATYNVLFDGVQVATYTLNDTVLIPVGEVISSDVRVNEVTLVNTCEECGYDITRVVDPVEALEAELSVNYDECTTSSEVEFILTITGGAPRYQYSIYNRDVAGPIESGQTNSVETRFKIDVAGYPASAGYYAVVTDSTGCSVETEDILVDNPSTSGFTPFNVSTKCGEGNSIGLVEVTISNMLGREALFTSGTCGRTIPANSSIVINDPNGDDQCRSLTSDNTVHPYNITTSVGECPINGDIQEDCYIPKFSIDASATCTLALEIEYKVSGLEGLSGWINVIDVSNPTVTVLGSWIPVQNGSEGTIQIEEDETASYKIVVVYDSNDRADSSRWEEDESTLTGIDCCFTVYQYYIGHDENCSLPGEETTVSLVAIDDSSTYPNEYPFGPNTILELHLRDESGYITGYPKNVTAGEFTPGYVLETYISEPGPYTFRELIVNALTPSGTQCLQAVSSDRCYRNEPPTPPPPPPPGDDICTEGDCECSTGSFDCFYTTFNTDGFPYTYDFTIFYLDGTSSSESFGPYFSGSEIDTAHAVEIPAWMKTASGAAIVNVLEDCGEPGYKYQFINPNSGIDRIERVRRGQVGGDSTTVREYTCDESSGTSYDACVTANSDGSAYCMTGHYPAPYNSVEVTLEGDWGSPYINTWQFLDEASFESWIGVASAGSSGELYNWIESVLIGSSASGLPLCPSDGLPGVTTKYAISIQNSPSQVRSITFKWSGSNQTTETSDFQCI